MNSSHLQHKENRQKNLQPYDVGTSKVKDIGGEPDID